MEATEGDADGGDRGSAGADGEGKPMYIPVIPVLKANGWMVFAPGLRTTTEMWEQVHMMQIHDWEVADKQQEADWRRRDLAKAPDAQDLAFRAREVAEERRRRLQMWDAQAGYRGYNRWYLPPGTNLGKVKYNPKFYSTRTARFRVEWRGCFFNPELFDGYNLRPNNQVDKRTGERPVKDKKMRRTDNDHLDFLARPDGTFNYKPSVPATWSVSSTYAGTFEQPANAVASDILQHSGRATERISLFPQGGKPIETWKLASMEKKGAVQHKRKKGAVQHKCKTDGAPYSQEHLQEMLEAGCSPEGVFKDEGSSERRSPTFPSYGLTKELLNYQPKTSVPTIFLETLTCMGEAMAPYAWSETSCSQNDPKLTQESSQGHFEQADDDNHLNYEDLTRFVREGGVDKMEMEAAASKTPGTITTHNQPW